MINLEFEYYEYGKTCWKSDDWWWIKWVLVGKVDGGGDGWCVKWWWVKWWCWCVVVGGGGRRWR